MAQQRKPTNLTLDTEIVAEAKALGVQLSHVAETGIAKVKTEAWKSENAEAIATTNSMSKRAGCHLKSNVSFKATH